jgi:RNA polymerase sigma factor (TIGR02999 family)
VSYVTRIFSQIEHGDQQATERLLPLVYDELRKLAAAKLAQEKPGQTLQPTALVHEAYIRLVEGQNGRYWSSRGHFFGAAAEAMRRILVENARRRSSLKRGGELSRQPFDDVPSGDSADAGELLALDEALEKLGANDSLAAELVKLRYFAGLPMDQAAETLGISPRTAYYTWNYARAWLRKALQAEDESRATPPVQSV